MLESWFHTPLRTGSLVLVLLSGTAAIAAAQGPASAPGRLAFGGPPPRVRTETELRAFLDELEAQEFAITSALSVEGYYQWKGEVRHFAGQFARLLADLQSRKDYAAVIDRWQGRVRDSTLARRLFLHHRDFLLARADPRLPLQLVELQTSVQDTLGQFRFEVRGQRITGTAAYELVDTSADRSLREEAFRSRTQISPHLRRPIFQAMDLEDRIGREEGFASGAAAGLALASLDPASVLRDVDAFELATRPAHLAILRRVKADLGVNQVEPWDIDYWLHRQELSLGTDAWPKEPGLARLRDLMRGLGFAVDSLPIDVKVWDVPTGGITFFTRPPYEARLLTNPFTGSAFYETLFHEYGHALNGTLMRPDLSPIFLRGDETPLGEGLAETLGHFAYDRHWLVRAAGVSPEQAERLEQVGKMQLLVWLRRSIVLQAYTEISLYRDRRANPDSLYAAAYRRFVGVELPPGDYMGSKDLFATGPLYAQSYLYANMIATQLREAMREQFGVDDLSREPRVGGWLTERFFAPGASVPWREKVERATGKPLSTDALARYLGDAAPPEGAGPSPR
jgi:peptidyl-dipeptidase A